MLLILEWRLNMFTVSGGGNTIIWKLHADEDLYWCSRCRQLFDECKVSGYNILHLLLLCVYNAHPVTKGLLVRGCPAAEWYCEVIDQWSKGCWVEAGLYRWHESQGSCDEIALARNYNIGILLWRGWQTKEPSCNYGCICGLDYFPEELLCASGHIGLSMDFIIHYNTIQYFWWQSNR